MNAEEIAKAKADLIALCKAWQCWANCVTAELQVACERNGRQVVAEMLGREMRKINEIMNEEEELHGKK